MAYINLTERCNLKCGFCELGTFANRRLQGEELGLIELSQIIDQLNNWGVKRLYLGGGEPLMRRDLWDILERISSKGLICSGLITNGTLLDEIGNREKKMLKKSVSILNISLDSQDPQLHDFLRGVQGTFAKVISFLERATSEDFPEIYITCVITKDTFREIPELIRLLSNYRVRHVGFQPVNFYSNYPDYKAVEDKQRFLLQGPEKLGELGKAIEEAIEVARSFRMSTNLGLLKFFLREYFLYAKTGIFFFDKLMRNFVCSNVFNYLHIDSKGNLLPCFLLPEVDNVIGKDLKEIWRRNALSLKEWALQRKFYPECQSCFCGFAANLRHCLIYHVISNFSVLTRLFPYYFMRSI